MILIVDSILEPFFTPAAREWRDRNARVQSLMLGALGRVREQLPPTAQEALAVAEAIASGSGCAGLEEQTRTALWKIIAGRDQDGTPGVLRIRATLCVLYTEVPDVDPGDTLEFFGTAFVRAGLEPRALAEAVATCLEARQT